MNIPVGRLPVISTRPVSAGDLARPAALPRTVTGRSCVWVAGVAPVGFPSLSAAVDEALAQSAAPALWDADITYTIRWVVPVGRGCYVVRGRVPE